MRILKIDVYNGDAKLLKTITCKHLDATKHITCLYEVNIPGSSDSHLQEYIIPEHIDHFTMIEGLVTIYYYNGMYLEISRLINND